MTSNSSALSLETIIDWIQSKIKSDDLQVNGSTELIKQNLLNSIEFLELVSYLEDQCDIELDPDLLVPENFDTPEAVYNMVVSTLNS